MINKVKNFFKNNTAQVAKNSSEPQEEYLKYKSDNLKLIGKVGVLEGQVRSLTDERDTFCDDLRTLERTLMEKDDEIEQLKEKLAESQGTKVTYASARKTMTAAKLKQMREALEAVPSGAYGFSASVSVYDKKTKRLRVIQVKTKAEALEIVAKAEKGHVEIVI